MRVAVRVYPGAARPHVGGRYGDSDPPTLIVRVRERAVDGKANEAVVTAIAEAFSTARKDVRLVTGATSRSKLLDVTGGEPARLAALLADEPDPSA